MSTDELTPAESRVMEALGGLSPDFQAMAVISNLFRSAAAVRRHMEGIVLADDRLSWTSFVGLWVLWVWGEMEANEFADAVGISRPTTSGVMSTLERRGYATRRKAAHDGRTVLVSLTVPGRRKIEQLFPRFNAEESAITGRLSPEERASLASLLRSLAPSVRGGA